MTEGLKNVIESLYRTFEKYHGNPNMKGSPNYGDLSIWNKELFLKPLRKLSEDDLSRFTGKAITTWGDTNDYKHFLPRIFELTAELKPPYDIWIAFDKLILADWGNWVENEQKIVRDFMIALWESILNENSQKAEFEFKNYFSALAHFYPSFSDLLIIWTEMESKAAIKHLSIFIVEEQTALFVRKKISGLHDQKENAEELINWILSDQVLRKIQQKYFEFETENFSEKISWAEQIITSERKKYLKAP